MGMLILKPIKFYFYLLMGNWEMIDSKFNSLSEIDYDSDDDNDYEETDSDDEEESERPFDYHHLYSMIIIIILLIIMYNMIRFRKNFDNIIEN